jgi:hypothetical protein
MSKINTDAVEPSTGTSLTLGASGDTISIPAGATIANSGTATGFGSDGTPMWDVNLSSNQTLTNATWTKINFNTERIDSDGAYDNSTNYRFTVPASEGGKYFVYTVISGSANGNNQLDQYRVAIYKNGAENAIADWDGSSGQDNTLSLTRIFDLSATDYLEVWARIEDTSGSPTIFGGVNYTWFGGYKIA